MTLAAHMQEQLEVFRMESTAQEIFELYFFFFFGSWKHPSRGGTQIRVGKDLYCIVVKPTKWQAEMIYPA
jgi:hypothetical protein